MEGLLKHIKQDDDGECGLCKDGVRFHEAKVGKGQEFMLKVRVKDARVMVARGLLIIRWTMCITMTTEDY